MAAARQTFEQDLCNRARHAGVSERTPVTIAYVFVSPAPIFVAEQYAARLDDDEKQASAVHAEVGQQPVPLAQPNLAHAYLAVAGRFSAPDTDYIDRALTYEGKTVAEAKHAFERHLKEWACDSDMPKDAPITIAYVLVSGAPLFVAEAYV